jgi:hypothetical protein
MGTSPSNAEQPVVGDGGLDQSTAVEGDPAVVEEADDKESAVW